MISIDTLFAKLRIQYKCKHCFFSGDYKVDVQGCHASGGPDLNEFDLEVVGIHLMEAESPLF